MGNVGDHSVSSYRLHVSKTQQQADATPTRYLCGVVVMTTGSSPIIRGVRLLNDCQVVGRVHFLASDWSARD